MAETAKHRHPVLFEFLEAWFASADLERRDDAQVIAAYAKVRDPEMLRQGRAVLAAKVFPWRLVARAANRRFADEAACRAWLEGVLRALD